MKMTCQIPVVCGSCGHKYTLEVEVPIKAEFKGPLIEFSLGFSPEELRQLLESQVTQEKLECRCCGSKKVTFPKP